MRPRRFELLLFALAWTSYAYFHQGGGWNQNGRFALTRALVETRRPWIDDYVVYVLRGDSGSTALRRLPVRDGCFTADGRSLALGWYAGDGPLVPLSPSAPATAELVTVDSMAATGDLAFARGHVHPNKAPGASLAAVPGYALVWGVERLFGIDVDDAWVMTINAWLTGVLSVGLLAALGVVAFWRLALRVSGGRNAAALFATIALAFGSLYFPYATMLYEHVPAAAALIVAFLFAFDAKRTGRFVAAGACAGAAMVFSYLSVIAAAILGVYVLYRAGRRAAVAFAAGTLPPLAVLGAYNLACFGTLLTTNYAWQNPLFKDAHGSVLDIFTAPDPGIFAMLLVSPSRGLFAITPVFVIGAIGLVAMIRSKRLRAEGLVCLAMIAHVFAFNVSFKAWEGGWACGPRYLIPALPFLALPMVLVGPRALWIRRGLLAVSIVAMALATAVDAQPPESPLSPVWSVNLPRFLNTGPGVSVGEGSVFEAMPGRFVQLGVRQAERNSFNAGEFVLPGRRASLLPWLAAAALLALLMKRELARGDQRGV